MAVFEVFAGAAQRGCFFVIAALMGLFQRVLQVLADEAVAALGLEQGAAQFRGNDFGQMFLLGDGVHGFFRQSAHVDAFL